jgi:Nucleotidyl transferase AbiEii toxin, Type IV TA system
VPWTSPLVLSAPLPIAELLAQLQQAFARLGVRWFLFGAQAAILHGVARLSADVDVTVDLGGRSSAELVAVLAEAGFELRVADIDGFVEATRVLPFVHRASRIPVDVVLAGPGLEEQFFAGVEERVIGDARVPVVCAEDLVAMKVLAGRPRDLEDVVAIIHARGHDLDLPRIRTTLGLLEAALARRDLVSELGRLVAVARRPGA